MMYVSLLPAQVRAEICRIKAHQALTGPYPKNFSPLRQLYPFPPYLCRPFTKTTGVVSVVDDNNPGSPQVILEREKTN